MLSVHWLHMLCASILAIHIHADTTLVVHVVHTFCLSFFCFALYSALPDLPVTYSTTDSNITLMWSTNLSCFEAEISIFTVMWSEINRASTNDTVKNITSYTLTELKPGTSYEIRVFAESIVGVLSSSVLYVRTESESTAAALEIGPGAYMLVYKILIIILM